jgi:predicted RNase H-like nuclease (RuvC/YqgF family)
MNVSSTSLGLEDSRTKSVKIARTNPRDLAKEVKKKDEEIHNLQAKLKEHQNIIVEL